MKHFICLCIGMLMYWNANAQYNIKGYNVAINDSYYDFGTAYLKSPLGEQTKGRLRVYFYKKRLPMMMYQFLYNGEILTQDIVHLDDSYISSNMITRDGIYGEYIVVRWHPHFDWRYNGYLKFGFENSVKEAQYIPYNIEISSPNGVIYALYSVNTGVTKIQEQSAPERAMDYLKKIYTEYFK